MRTPRRAVLIGLFVCLVAISVLLARGLNSRLRSLQPFLASCKTDAEASEDDITAVDKVAIDFVQDALGPNPEVAYSMLTADARSNVSSEKFVAGFKQGIQRNGPFKDVRAAHTYFPYVTGGTQEQRVVCGNLARPEGWVAVNAKPNQTQAHVVVEAQTLNNTWAFTSWLFREQGNWHIQYTQATITAVVGKNAEDLQRMAKSETHENHNFNAYILYVAALQLAARGPFLQLGIQPEIQKSMETLRPPLILQGKPPFNWQLGKSSFKVLSLGPVGSSQKIYLKIDYEIEPWAKDIDADNKNRELITAFSSSYPEYKHAFAGLVVTAHERGGLHGYGTVSENDVAAK
jgi:hypothetical protein